MKLKTIIFLVLTALATGTLFFMVQRNWLVVHFAFSPFTGDQHAGMPVTAAQQKKINVYYRKNSAWHHEEVAVIWHEQDMAQSLKHIVKQWLSVLQDVHQLAPHISVQSVAVASTGSDAYISFDASLFDPAVSITRSWMIIESLGKTIRMAEVPIHAIALLVDNVPMSHDYIDLSIPLPLEERL